MDAMPEALPDDVEALKAALLAMRGRAALAEAELTVARVKLDIIQAEAADAKARVSDQQALIAHLKLQIAKLRRERFGTSSERTDRLLDQLEL
jgi:transposase